MKAPRSAPFLTTMPLRSSILLLLPLLGLTQCFMPEGASPVDPMPDATQTGANTAGCRVDGLPWVARTNAQAMSGAPLSAVSATWGMVRPPAHHLSLSFDKQIDVNSDVHSRTYLRLELPGITRPGTVVLDQKYDGLVINGPIAYAAFIYYQTPPDQQMRTGPATPGRVVVTRLDTVARVVSGTFEFTARNPSGGSTVRVTEGRFDCKF